MTIEPTKEDVEAVDKKIEVLIISVADFIEKYNTRISELEKRIKELETPT